MHDRLRGLEAIALLGVLPLVATAAGTSATSTLTAERDFVILPAAPASTPRLTPSTADFSVRLAGVEQPIVAVDPTDTWRIVVYADPALATPSGILTSSDALARSAPELTALGTVEIVVADPFAETILEPTTDARDLQQAFAEIEDLADGAGEVLVLREEETEFAIEEELELVRERRLELLRWLATNPVRGPACLILLQDGFDIPDAAPESERHDQQLLAATLAATGWTVLPLVPASDYAHLIPGRKQVLSDLAQVTGGALLVDAQDLENQLSRLANASTVTVRLTGPADGIPMPLEIQASGFGSPTSSPRWAAVATPTALTEIRALQVLQEPDLAAGTLETSSALRPEMGARPRPEGFPAILEAMVELGPGIARSPLFRVSILLVELEGMPQVTHELIDPGPLEAIDAWLYRRRAVFSDELAGGSVVIEDIRSGRWGAAPLELSDSGLPTMGRRVAEYDAPGLESRSRRQAAQSSEEAVVIRILPPRKRPVKGRTRFETLVSSPLIDKVDFFLDGEAVATDDGAPFSATLDLGPEPVTHTIKVTAYRGSGTALGSHEITVNATDDSFLVRIVEISNPLGGILNVEARVRVPAEAELDRVEFYWNEALVETFESEPFRVELPAPDAGSQDFVRVVAYLSDGTWIDDAQLLSGTSLSERLEVNLVQLHVVVTDRDGKPVQNLSPEAFSVRLRGKEQQIERLGPAEEVPLILGVVIDTSESMWSLMVDTQKAGSQFVANTLREGDSAFLVDFDTQPRLAQDTTTDLMRLLKTFGGLTADGFTALYDAVIFSMLQFEEAEGRKALVLLTDGDDYRSRYGPRRCIQYGNRLGVPVYIISLAGIHNARRNLRRIDLEGISEGTGGQVYYISEMQELTDAYRSINNELRSQYILTFSTARELGEEELESLDVEVEGKGLSVRAVVGGQLVQ